MSAKVGRPKALLMDAVGTLTDVNFNINVLTPFFAKNHQVFLEANFDKPATLDVIDHMRTAAQRSEDKQTPQIAGKEAEKGEIIKTVNAYVDYLQANHQENRPMILYRFLVWFDGYDRGLLCTPVNEEVVANLKKWTQQNIKIYVLSHGNLMIFSFIILNFYNLGWTVANRKFLEKTSHGNILALITDVMDTEMGSLTNPETFIKVAARVKEEPKSIVYLTKAVSEALSASASGMQVIMVLNDQKRIDNAKEVEGRFPHVSNFNEIEFV